MTLCHSGMCSVVSSVGGMVSMLVMRLISFDCYFYLCLECFLLGERCSGVKLG